MDWVAVVLGVVAIAFFGRGLTPRGAARQADRNARSRFGGASLNPGVIQLLCALFVLVGVYLLASGFDLI